METPTESMKAVVLARDFKLSLTSGQVPIPQPGAGQVRIQIFASALNRRDYWITQKMYPNIKLPTILGSDCCGRVVALGEGVAESWKDVLVVVNPTNGWPAGVSEAPAMHDLSILGMPRDGTLAEYVVVDVSRVHRKPEHLSEVEAAALPLAGVTAFRALFHQAQAKRGSKVFVTGIGSGVATFVVQFAAAIGCQIVVSSGSQEKLDAALARHPLLGGVLYTAPTKEWTKDALNYIKNEGFDIVIDGAGGKDFNELLKLLKPGGRLVSYGATVGKPADFDIFRVFLLQLKILGTSMGSDEDFAEMLKFVEEHRIIPVIAHVHPWEDAVKAIGDMCKSDSRGKVIILSAKL